MKNSNSFSKYDQKLILENGCEIIEQDEDDSITRERYKFVKLDKLRDMSAGLLVDVLGIVQDVFPFVTVITKNGESKSKRNLMIFDDSCVAVDVVWIFF